MAFQSDASNTVAGDTNGRADVFVHGRGMHTTAGSAWACPATSSLAPRCRRPARVNSSHLDTMAFTLQERCLWSVEPV